MLLASYNNYACSGLLSWFPHPQVSVASESKDSLLHHVAPRLYIANRSLPYVFSTPESSLMEQALWGTRHFPGAEGRQDAELLGSPRASLWMRRLSLLLKSICPGKP